MTFLSKYSGIFGQPGKGIHKHTFGNIAIMDYTITITIAYLIAYFTDVPLSILVIILLVLAILVHYIFGVKSSVSKYIGLV
jgi:hypothetical protein